MRERFLATNKRINKFILGTWRSVCDLDNRTWFVRPFDIKEKPPEPLATIFVVKEKFTSPIYKEIYSLIDLEGVYLGQE